MRLDLLSKKYGKGVIKFDRNSHLPPLPCCRRQQELIMKLLQQAHQHQGPGAGSSGWSGAPSSGLTKAGKPQALALLEMQQEAERLLKQQQQQRAQQQRDRVSQPQPRRRRPHTHAVVQPAPLLFLSQHSSLSMGGSSLGSHWSDGVGMWGGPGGMDGKGVSGGSSSSMGMWDEAMKNQGSLRGSTNNNMGLKNSRSSPSLRCKTLSFSILVSLCFCFFFGFFNVNINRAPFQSLQRTVHDAA